MSMGRGLQKYMGSGNNPVQNGGMPYGMNPNQNGGQSYSSGARDDSNSLFSNRSMGLMGLGGLAGSLADGLFNNNYRNPSDAAMGALDQIPEYAKSYDPYITSGQNALHSNEDLYNHLLSNPGDQLNQIGQGYHQSPGYQYALQQALANVGNSVGSRGMTGTPQDEMERMRTATGLASQDYDSWMNNALGLYGQGIQGRRHIQDVGYEANNEKTQDLMNRALSQAQLQYEGQNTANQEDDPFSQVFSGISAALPFLATL